MKITLQFISLDLLLFHQEDLVLAELKASTSEEVVCPEVRVLQSLQWGQTRPPQWAGQGTGLALISIFFSSLFVKKKSLLCLVGESMTPNWYLTWIKEVRVLFLSFLPINPSSWSWTGFLSFKGSQPHLVLCFRTYRDPRTPSGEWSACLLH